MFNIDIKLFSMMQLEWHLENSSSIKKTIQKEINRRGKDV